MTADSMHPRPSNSLERDYLILSLLILFILLLFCTFAGWQLHKSQEKARIVSLHSKLHMVKDRFNTSLDNVSNYMQFVGDRILNLKSNDIDGRANLFQNNFSLDSNLRNFYSWTLLNWVNANQEVVITSQEGLLRKPYPVPSYYPLAAARKKAWQLQTGMPRLTEIGKYPTIPAAMAIENDHGEYLGSIISDVLVEKIERDLSDALKEEEADYLIIDANAHVLFSTTGIALKELPSTNPSSLSFESFTDRNLPHPIKLGNVTFTIAGKTNYPFIVLVGYQTALAQEQFREDLLSYIYLASAITFVFLGVLFIFRQRIILPIIERLKDTLATETAMRIENERLLAHILNKIPGFVYRHRMQDNIIYTLFVSEGCQKVTGYTSEQYMDDHSVNHTDVIHPDYLTSVVTQIKDAFSEFKSFEISYPITTASGESKWVLNQGVPVTQSNAEGKIFEGLLTDITDIKNAEQEMARMVKDLAISNEELKRFAHICSHDLKEPLRSIFSYIQLFKAENDLTALNDNANEYLNFIETGALRLKQLIEDILLYSELGAEPVQNTHIDLEHLIHDVLKSLRATIHEKNATIHVDNRLQHIAGNDSQIFRLFQNILSNALKFNTDTPVIHIQSVQKENMCLIFIRDNGIGISKDFAHRIFELFERLHPKDQYPGSGIGLALCHRIVEHHGGKIWVDSELGQGATFFFTLPLHADSLGRA